jgi:hypothetical protein
MRRPQSSKYNSVRALREIVANETFKEEVIHAGFESTVCSIH